MKTYDILTRGGRECIRCRQCGARSYDPSDLRNRYCGSCKIHHDLLADAILIAKSEPDGLRMIAGMVGWIRPIEPRNEAAEATYEGAWKAWVATEDDVARKRLENVMDGLQPAIAHNPTDPRWVRFKHSLTGYIDFWLGWKEATVDSITTGLFGSSRQSHVTH